MSKANKKSPYQIVASRNIYKNPWLKVREDKVVDENGRHLTFGLVRMKEGSSVLAVDNNKEVYLTKEYKYGTQKYSVEVMSGGIERNEKPLTAAKRELKEELGLTARKWVNLGYVDPFTNIINSKNHLFLAFKIKKSAANPDKTENIEIIKMPLRKAVIMVMEGKITHAASCVLILKAEKHLKSL